MGCAAADGKQGIHCHRGTTTAAVLSPPATGPPGPVRWVRLSSGTTARFMPSVSTANAIAADGACWAMDSGLVSGFGFYVVLGGELEDLR